MINEKITIFLSKSHIASEPGKVCLKSNLSPSAVKSLKDAALLLIVHRPLYPITGLPDQVEVGQHEERSGRMHWRWIRKSNMLAQVVAADCTIFASRCWPFCEFQDESENSTD